MRPCHPPAMLEMSPSLSGDTEWAQWELLLCWLPSLCAARPLSPLCWVFGMLSLEWGQCLTLEQTLPLPFP